MQGRLVWGSIGGWAHCNGWNGIIGTESNVVSTCLICLIAFHLFPSSHYYGPILPNYGAISHLWCASSEGYGWGEGRRGEHGCVLLGPRAIYLSSWQDQDEQVVSVHLWLARARLTFHLQVSHTLLERQGVGVTGELTATSGCLGVSVCVSLFRECYKNRGAVQTDVATHREPETSCSFLHRGPGHLHSMHSTKGNVCVHLCMFLQHLSIHLFMYVYVGMSVLTTSLHVYCLNPNE